METCEHQGMEIVCYVGDVLGVIMSGMRRANQTHGVSSVEPRLASVVLIWSMSENIPCESADCYIVGEEFKENKVYNSVGPCVPRG